MGLFDFGKKKREAEAATAQASYEKGMHWYNSAKNAEWRHSDCSHAADCFRSAAEADHARARYMLAWMCYNGRGVAESNAEAARWCALAAEQGVADAQYFYGFLLEMGDGVEKDLTACCHWYSLAAAQGHHEAMWRLANLYDEGRGCPKSKKKAEELWRTAAEGGYTDAQMSMGDLYRRRGNMAEAEKWFRLAEAQGASFAADRLDDMGLISTRTRILTEQRLAREAELRQIRAVTAESAAAAFRKGLERQKEGDSEMAGYWIEAAAENGCGEAAYEMAERWRKKRKDPQLSDRMIRQWLQRSSELGYMEGRARLAWALATGANGAQVDLEEARRLAQDAAATGHKTAAAMLNYMEHPLVSARELYDQGKKEASLGCLRIAAESGDREGMYLLGERYYEGDGTKQNLEKAKRWLRKASSLSWYDADFLLGVIAMEQEDYPEAIRRFQYLAQCGIQSAEYNLALAHRKNGEPEKGMPWLRRAAENGLAMAQHALALNYLKGIGTEWDEEEALRWLHRCIEEHQYPRAMFTLARMYVEGQGGLRKDLELAADWYEKAAEGGYGPAMYNIAVHYANGEGRERDLSKAMRWARKARDAGVEGASHLYDKLFYQAAD